MRSLPNAMNSGSLIITSNRAFEEWGEIFANDLLASAALDRLTHHAHTLVIRGDSFRQRSRRKEIASNKSTSEAPIKPEILTPSTLLLVVHINAAITGTHRAAIDKR